MPHESQKPFIPASESYQAHGQTFTREALSDGSYKLTVVTPDGKVNEIPCDSLEELNRAEEMARLAAASPNRKI